MFLIFSQIKNKLEHLSPKKDFLSFLRQFGMVWSSRRLDPSSGNVLGRGNLRLSTQLRLVKCIKRIGFMNVLVFYFGPLLSFNKMAALTCELLEYLSRNKT